MCGAVVGDPKIAERLDDCFRLLYGRRLQSTLCRASRRWRAPRSTGATTCCPPQQVLLRRLAVFQGRLDSLEAAEARRAGSRRGGPSHRCSSSSPNWWSEIPRRHRPPRAHVPPARPCRQYALERLEASGEAADISAMPLRYFLVAGRQGAHGTRRPRPGGVDWLAREQRARQPARGHAWCGRVGGGAELGLLGSSSRSSSTGSTAAGRPGRAAYVSTRSRTAPQRRPQQGLAPCSSPARRATSSAVPRSAPGAGGRPGHRARAGRQGRHGPGAAAARHVVRRKGDLAAARALSWESKPRPRSRSKAIRATSPRP